MRRLVLLLSVSALSISAFGQGIVNFANTPTTLVSYSFWNDGSGLISGPAGSWYFGLLVAPPGTTDPVAFTFTGVYATNSGTAAGRFINNGVQVPGWAAGVTKSYEIAGWGASLGPTFNPAWLSTYPAGLFTISPVGTGAAGGTDLNGNPLPALPLFGGTGISSGFTFATIPEPSTLALAGLAAVSLSIFGRKK